MFNKKGVEEGGKRWIFKVVAGLIIFLVLIAILLFIYAPKTSPEKTNQTIYNFGKNIWDIVTAGD